MTENIANHAVVPHEEWIVARTSFLAREKELTRLRDELSQARRDLPWEAVTKKYVFQTADGQQTLAELFDGRSQLVIYHFMLAPEWKAGCKSCSFWADNFEGIDIHLAHRDVTLIAVSRAPLVTVDAYKKRMGWHFKWVSSFGSDFNYDYQASYTSEQVASGNVFHNYAPSTHAMSDLAGISVFFRSPDNAIFHTYSCYARGLDMMNGAYHYLDLTPKGRDEHGLAHTMDWVRRHDEY